MLKTVGADEATILRTFMFQGTINGLFGVLFGGVFGVVLALQLPSLFGWLENTFGFALLPDDIYFVSSIPTDVQWQDVALVVGVALLMSILATLYPAYKATQVNPARALVGD